MIGAASLQLLAQSTQAAQDDISPMMLAMLVGLVFVAVAAAVLVLVLSVVCVVHLTLAIVIWTRRPRTRIWAHKGWWGVLTLLFGLLAAIPFFILHYRRGAPARCYHCGYDAAGTKRGSLCPECGKPRVGDSVSKVDSSAPSAGWI
jgi:hypothetical protein